MGNYPLILISQCFMVTSSFAALLLYLRWDFLFCCLSVCSSSELIMCCESTVQLLDLCLAYYHIVL